MIELGLARISKLLSNTRLPWRAIHVAGTNGKGSVCAAVSRQLDVYNSSGWRTAHAKPMIRHGSFTSPHIVYPWDCIRIDGKTVAASLFHAVETKVHERNRAQDIRATEFECLTATAFEIFTRENVDVAVVEVGMGGRLDATNILGQRDLPVPHGCTMDEFRAEPLVSAVTKIGLDHQALLGNTLQDIAAQKAGIFKSGVPFVSDETNWFIVNAVLAHAAAQTNAPPAPHFLNVHIGEAILTAKRAHQTAQKRTKLSLPQHILANAAVAFNATWAALDRLHGLESPPLSHRTFLADALPQQFLSSDDLGLLAKRMAAVALSTNVPGRQQTLSLQALTGRVSPVLLDGAHNPQSAAALAQALQRRRTGDAQRHSETNAAKASRQPTTWVLAMSDGRDAQALLRPLLEHNDRVVVVAFGPVATMPWVKPMPPAALRDTASDVIASKGGKPEVEVCETVLEGLKKACAWAGEHGPIVITGSLYLAGDVLRLLNRGRRRLKLDDADAQAREDDAVTEERQ